MTLGETLNHAVRLHNSGDLPQAKNIYLSILEKAPNQADALHLLGVIAYQEGDYLLSLKYLHKAQNRLENRASWQLHYGQTLLKLKRFKEAENALIKSAKINANTFDTWNLLAKLYVDKEAYKDARYCYKNAYRLEPKNIDLIISISNLFIKIGEYDSADKILHEALSIVQTPQDEISIRYHITNLYYAIKLNPKLALEYFNPAIPLLLKVDSKDLYKKGDISSYIAFLKMILNEWENLLPLINIIKDNLKEKHNPISPSFLLCSNHFSAQEQYICSNNYANFRAKGVEIIDPLPILKKNDISKRSLRLGLLSSDLLTDHPVYYVIIAVFEHLKRQGIEIYIYATKELTEGMEDNEKRLIIASTKIHYLENKKYREIALRIQQDKIDILIDLNGYTKNSHYGAFYYSPAPVLVNWLGYPGTIGGEHHDWIIGDKFVTPKGEEKNFSEKIWRMPHTYFPTDNTRLLDRNLDKKDYHLPKDKIIFSSFSNSYKITAEIFDIWCEILMRVPNSILWLSWVKHLNQDRLHKEAKRKGILPERLVFAQRVDSIDEHISRLQLVDIALDTSPYNMHTTCVDFLWAGVPVITLQGHTFASRVAESLLNAANLPELVAKNRDEYIELAVELATNPKKLSDFKNRCIKSKTNSPLFNPEMMAKDLKEAFLTMYKIKTGIKLTEQGEKI